MPARTSAGLVLYRRGSGLEVLLGHMGGPYFVRKDDGGWSIPKGEYDETEPAFDAARREFAEEIGIALPAGGYLDLGSVTQRNGKIVTAWAVEGDFEPGRLVSNTFELEWPPRSGTLASFPEIDRVAWFDVPTARTKALASQGELFDRLVAALS
jgi:predicted NUDIX family NTP pyrophosphohydrolase